MSHIALDARRGRLPKGPCRECDKGLLRRGLIDCRQRTPLNGTDAVHEFTRALRPWAKARLLALPVPEVPPALFHEYDLPDVPELAAA